MNDAVNISRRLDWLLPAWLEDVDAYSQSINEDMISVFYTVLANSILCVICILFFSVYRMYDDKLFSPKSDMFPDRTPRKLSNSTPFGWICDLYIISDEVIIENGGYDVLFLIRFYRLGFKIMAWSSLFCCFVLMPINATASDMVPYSSFDRWSMTNVPQQSGKCWFHLVGVFIFTGVTIYFLEREFVIYAKYRHIYLRQTHAHLRTVLVEGIPSKFRSPRTLAAYFDLLYPGAVARIMLAQDLSRLEGLVARREACVAELERCLYADHNGHQRPAVWVEGLSQSVGAIRYHSDRLSALNAEIAVEQTLARRRAALGEVHQSATGTSSVEVGDFLRVTEIDSVRKTFRDSRAVGAQAAASLAANRQRAAAGSRFAEDRLREELDCEYQSYQQSSTAGSGSRTNGDMDRVYGGQAGFSPLSGGGVGADDSDSDGDGDLFDLSASRVSRGGRAASLGERLWGRRVCPTMVQCFARVRDGHWGKAPREEEGDEELSALISPPEERQLYLSKAFVTFRTFAAATTARQVVHMQLAGRMVVREAPEPSDVVWGNLYGTRKGTRLRRVVAEFLVLLLIIVWVAPVTLLSFVLSADALRGVQWVDAYCRASPLFESGVQMLQPLALVGLMNLLPPVLTYLAALEGCTSFSTNQLRSFHRYFTFQIVNVFLVTAIAGSVVSTLGGIYRAPNSAFQLLGASLPQMGGFFMNYTLVKALAGLGAEMVRLFALVSAGLKLAFTSNVTPRDRRATPLFGAIRSASDPCWFPYAKVYAQDMLLFVLGATYASISPLVLLAGMLYFAGAASVYKHQLLYVYEPVFETGGRWWPTMARCVVVALLFAQSTMVGMMVLKQTHHQIYYLGALVAFTSGYYWHVASTYEPLASQLPLDMAMAMDRELAEVASAPGREEELEGAEDYLQPAIRAAAPQPEVEFPVEARRDLADI